MKNTLPILILLLVIFSCAKNQVELIEVDYLGQSPPGNTATLFAPGIVSTDAMEHSAPVFSPDGTTVLWTVVPDGFSKPAYFLEMNYERQKWSTPHRAAFNDSTADDYYPSFSVDGKTLFFSSRRKLLAGYTQSGDMRIWQVERKQNSWGTPVPVDTLISKGREFAHTITRDGNIFFSAGFFSDALNGKTGWSIHKADLAGNKAPTVTRLPYSINSMGYEDGPFIAPDESFLIFESDRPEGLGGTDLYLSFRSEEGLWSRPVNMGPSVNSTFSERFARLSPDGKYLFYGSSRDEREGHPGFDIYWIDASIINELRNSRAASEPIQDQLGESLLTALDLGHWNEASEFLEHWLSAHPDDADAVFNYAHVLKKQKKYDQAFQFLSNHEQLFKGKTAYMMEIALLNIALGNQETAIQLLAPLLADKAQEWNRSIYLSSSLFDMQMFDVSDDYFKKAMTVNMWSYGYFKRGCSYASLGEQDRAFENLLLAAENGFTDQQHFESQPELQSLKSNSRWPHLRSRLK